MTDMILNLGTTFVRTVKYTQLSVDGTPVNLTNYAAKMQVRPSATSSSVILDLTPTIDGPNGTLTITVPYNATINLNLINTPEQTLYETNADGSSSNGYGKTGYYDLKIKSLGGVVETILSGQIVFVQGVTKGI